MLGYVQNSQCVLLTWLFPHNAKDKSEIHSFRLSVFALMLRNAVFHYRFSGAVAGLQRPWMCMTRQLAAEPATVHVFVGLKAIN